MALGQEDKVARRYARALFEATPPTEFDSTGDQLSTLSKLWSESADFRECVLNPRVTEQQRGEALEAVVASLGGWRNEPLKRTAHILVALRKAPVFPLLEETFAALVREYRKSLALEIFSAHPLGDQDVSALRDQLSSTLGGAVTLTTHHDPALIGGLTIRMGDRLLDRSVAGTLTRLAEQLSR